MNRRDFVLSGLALLAPRVSIAATARIDILPDEVIGTISPNIYSHFTEHLGGCIYDGIWVGEKSKVPNIGGIRKALIDKLRLLKPAVIRWPGGCFADSYNWRDGVGPRDRRPTRTNFWANTPYLRKGAGRSSEIRSQSIRHQRICAFLQTGRRSALLRGQPAELDPVRLLRMGRVL